MDSTDRIDHSLVIQEHYSLNAVLVMHVMRGILSMDPILFVSFSKHSPIFYWSVETSSPAPKSMSLHRVGQIYSY